MLCPPPAGMCTGIDPQVESECICTSKWCWTGAPVIQLKHVLGEALCSWRQLGSYGKLAQNKAKFLNGFVEENKIGSVAEFGCGDGNQLSLSMHVYPRYLGFDVSQTVLSRLRARFARDEKATFLHVSAFNASVHAVDLALSLDVIFHLVEDAVFDAYMRRLLAASRRFVVIYSSNEDRPARGHVRHRSFAAWMSSRAEGRLFKLVRHENNPMGCSLRERGCGDSGGSSFASFWVFSRTR